VSGFSDFFIGTDRYTVERKLGEGSFGVVYSAFDRQLERWVALKLLSRVGVKFLYLFRKEFRPDPAKL
jgi:serine/threonine protein kinase